MGCALCTLRRVQSGGKEERWPLCGARLYCAAGGDFIRVDDVSYIFRASGIARLFSGNHGRVEQGIVSIFCDTRSTRRRHRGMTYGGRQHHSNQSLSKKFCIYPTLRCHKFASTSASTVEIYLVRHWQTNGVRRETLVDALPMKSVGNHHAKYFV